VGLGGRIHHQQIAVIQAKREGRLSGRKRRTSRAKTQIARNADAQGGDGGLVVEFRFVIGMPAHAVVSSAVAVQQQAVEANPQLLLQEIAKGRNGGTPGGDGLHLAAVAVAAAGVSHPAGQTRRGVLAAKDAHQGLLPGNLLSQALTQGFHGDSMAL